MCGIAGIVATEPAADLREGAIRSMLAALQHRGPDEFGYFTDELAAIGNARLSIVDLSGGSQPIPNEDESMWIVFNGEIFNHVELRPQLEALGHRFRTHSDTEVILHLYEEYGPACLSQLNGQFAIAIWDQRRSEMFLARDRLGVRPLFYSRANGVFCFGSEVKAVLASGLVPAALNPSALLDVFTYWAPVQGGSVLQGIAELPPGHWMKLRGGEATIERYWALDFSRQSSDRLGEGELLEQFQSLLVDAAQIRLRADVPVGAYLSGGLDSSTIAAVVRKYTTNRLNTFSIAFTDRNFDEREHQLRMADYLGTTHHVVEATHADIGRIFPEVIWHAEVPLLRTAPAPMFLLSKLVRQTGFKVVLTGEGADEFLGGYDIFKEARLRRFWAREASSSRRPRLFSRLYPDIFKPGASSVDFVHAFFGEGLEDVDDPFYSHAVRWRNNRRTWRFLHPDIIGAATVGPAERVASLLPESISSWGPLERAQYVEVATFLSQYLLSAQGDRMAMANSVEGRYPFLDYRVVEFCSRLPSTAKMRGLREKRLLRKFADTLLPAEISQRPKRPYRAPIHRSFFGDGAPDYVRELLSPGALKESSIFNPAPVSQLVAKLDAGKPLGETDDMALAAILSTQLLHHQFIASFQRPTPLPEARITRAIRPSTKTHTIP